VLCVAKDETSVDISCAEGFVVISCGKVDYYDKYGLRVDLCPNICPNIFYFMSERLIDATSILHYELEGPPV
jgi:hypothetical protein